MPVLRISDHHRTAGTRERCCTWQDSGFGKAIVDALEGNCKEKGGCPGVHRGIGAVDLEVACVGTERLTVALGHFGLSDWGKKPGWPMR